MSPSHPTDPRRQALGEIVRLAQEDRRRGVRAWFDPGLAEDLRAFAKEIESGPPRPASPTASIAPRPVPLTPAIEPAPPFATVSESAEASPHLTPPQVGSVEASSSPSRGAARVQWGAPPAAEGREADWADRLRAVGEEAAACTACGLCRTRTNVVYGVGRATVPLVFVGEAPGRDEDLQGIPFVGRAGQLLTKIIAAIGIDRDDVYICNVLKCRPPENRNPAPDEIVSCRPLLERQLEILKPKVICTLGLFASQLLLESTAPIGKLRGRLFTQGGWRILPTYHPAALLRNPSLKATVWEDVQLLRRVLDE
jgi:DNA polymerase